MFAAWACRRWRYGDGCAREQGVRLGTDGVMLVPGRLFPGNACQVVINVEEITTSSTVFEFNQSRSARR